MRDESCSTKLHFGLATDGLTPPKSNWARPIAKPPYLAYPLVGGLAYTFGGLATNERAEVLAEDGPVPGLYAAGETTGHFHGTAPKRSPCCARWCSGALPDAKRSASYRDKTLKKEPPT